MRYRYRLYPTPAQGQSLARAFGCSRWVFNECLRVREAAYARGEWMGDTEMQRQAVTLARRSSDTAWLADVSCTPLIQACRDAGRAYRNWFDSLSGKTRGRKVGRPRFRSKSARQSMRFTRNGFRIRGDRLYLAKVGDLRVAWSRALPATPSSVTVIKEADGRYYASFVVTLDPTPLPRLDRAAGIDLGLKSFAVIAYTDGAHETIRNQRHMRAAGRRLARAQRKLARKRKTSANRAKARRVVAVQHRKVRDRRMDHHHKLALRLIRENQAVGVEDLAIHAMARGRLAKSVNDAGWRTFLHLLDQKAEQYGRQVVRIGRFEPTSRICSACGVNGGRKGLEVRYWTCFGCGASHNRDVNAARNILVAAGLAETLNACGASVRPDLGEARSSEAGTRRSMA